MRVSRVWVYVIGMMLLCTGGAAAQSPGASESSTEPTLAQELTSAPIPGQGGVAITAGGSLQTGRTETKGFVLDGIVSHTTSNRVLLRFEAESNSTYFRPHPTSDYLKIDNNHMITTLALRPVARRVSILGIGGFRRDTVLGLLHRVWIEGGIGFHLVEGRRANLLVAPLFALGDERRAHTTQGDAVRDFGILQSFVLHVNPHFLIEEQFQSHVETSESDDHATRFNISALSKINRHVGLKLSYQSNYDALPPPGTEARQQKVAIALQVSFARNPATKSKP